MLHNFCNDSRFYDIPQNGGDMHDIILHRYHPCEKITNSFVADVPPTPRYMCDHCFRRVGRENEQDDKYLPERTWTPGKGTK